MRASVFAFFSTLFALPASAQAPAAIALPESTITVSVGTRVQAALQRRFLTRSTDSVYLVATYPVSVNGVIAIPAGTYLQALFDRVTGKGAGGIRHGPVLATRLDYLIYPNGYVARVSSRSSVVATSDVGYDRDQHGGVVVAVIGMAVSPFVGGAIGGADGGIRGAGRGLLIGTGIGVAAGNVALALAHDWVLETGEPVEVELQDSLTVDRAHATAPGAVSNLGLIPLPPRK